MAITQDIPQTVTQEQVNEAIAIWTAENPSVDIKVSQRTNKYFNYFAKCSNLHDVDLTVEEVLAQYKYTKIESATAICKKELAKFLKYFTPLGTDHPLIVQIKEEKIASQLLAKADVDHTGELSDEQIEQIIAKMEQHVSETYDKDIVISPSISTDSHQDIKHNITFKKRFGDFLAMLSVKLARAGLRNDAGLIMTRRVSTGKGWYPSYYTRNTGIIKYRTHCKKTSTWDCDGFEYQCTDFEKDVLEQMYNEVPNRLYLFSPSQVSPRDTKAWKKEMQNIMNQFGVAIARASEITNVKFTTYSFRRERATTNIQDVLQAKTPEEANIKRKEALQTIKNMGHSVETAVNVYFKNPVAETIPSTCDVATQTSELPEGRLFELTLEQMILESAEQVCKQKLKKILCSILSEL